MAALLSAMALTVFVYWVGLHGPFLLDDQNNLYIIDRWLQGNASIRDVLLGGQSGISSRPVSMASFVLGAWLAGSDPFTYKLGNLLIHLLNGVVAYALVRQIAQRDDRLRPNAAIIAALVAALWLLHPLHASTVLYAVQRMAQLSALFLLLGMWFYIVMRERLEQRPTPTMGLTLFVGTVALLATGFMAKENAVLLPALCLILELGYFSRTARPAAVRWFFALLLWLPLLAGLFAFALAPGRLLGGYLKRDFDLTERLLSEARALCDYLWLTVAPNPPRMGVYTDDFVTSTGLLSPPTTLAAIIVLAAITFTAWHLRRRIPALFVGWGIFLVGHALESTLIPLELYFEHRNYLPMLGILYALVGLAAAAGDRLRAVGLRPGRIGAVLAVGILALYAFGTHGRARVWSTPESLALSAVASHPYSMRANLTLVKSAFEHGNAALAEDSLARLASADDPRTRASAHLIRLYFHCLTRHDADPRDLSKAMAVMPPVITTTEVEYFSTLYFNAPQGCGRVTDVSIADALNGMVNRAQSQSDGEWQKWFLRGTAARFYLRADEPRKARAQAELAWQPGTDVGMAALVIQTQLAMADVAAAARTLAEAERRIDPSSKQSSEWIDGLRAQIDLARHAIPSKPK